MSYEPIDFSWTARARCKGEDPNEFFPVRGEELVGVLALCAECPVRAECLAHALEHKPMGVWGGTSARQRQRLRRRSGITLREVPTIADVWREDTPPDVGDGGHRDAFEEAI